MDNIVLSYRRRDVSTADVQFIRDLIAKDPTLSRRALSLTLCRHWHWTQNNGTLKDAVCRGLLLALHRAGHIELPPPRWYARQPARRHRIKAHRAIDTAPITGSLADLGSIELRQVRREDDEPLLEALIGEHHYLGYSRPVGAHLKYLAYAGDRVLAAAVWSSAPRHLAPRDRYIGWSMAARQANLHHVVYNSRFLILPWVTVPHLASHLLAKMTRQLSDDWQRLYGHPLYFAETFVDPTRFVGTCYRAANWIELGITTGRGKDDQTHRANRSRKTVLGYPLHRHFRARLCALDPRCGDER